ncbi:NAD(P)/FAD-dependent oxidoreductase [Halorussus halophilus]|uniref:NAD(P)/FAD-dependent oxidoreductase n=1 Tax=Halorussus halophilus TaxID=2650975 RepID=UPI001300DC2D|nr:FAD-dependent oxidoreductase [Halorussus halophilus]
MTDIAIVGAGVAGLGAAYALRDADATVTVFEREAAVGGRAATRRRAGCVYDVGANYAKGGDDRVANLFREVLSDGLVDTDGPVWTFDDEGEISEGKDDDAPKWTYEDGLSTLGERLADASGATIRTGTEVVGLAREADDWRVQTSEDTFRADALVLTPPAPQTAELLAGADWDDERRETLPDEIARVPYRSLLTVALHYDYRREEPYYALVDTSKDHDLGWVAREECKPGHVPDGESLLIVQPSPRWSAEHFDDSDEDIAVAAADRSAELLGDPDRYQPDWFDVVRWRDALPDASADEEVLSEAASVDLYFAGDWVVGEGRVHAALRSGLETGKRLEL